jgi:hypothetical protein
MNDTSNDFFHPTRYLKSRPFAKRLFEKYKTTDLYKSDRVNEQMGDMIQVFNEELSKYAQQQRKRLIAKHIGNASDITNQELSLFVETQRFRHRGSNIFYFPSGISSLFKQTDVNEVVIGDIKFPYKTFYIAFGAQTEFDIGFEDNTGFYFDGAYIDQLDEKVLSIRLTSVRLDRDYKTETNWFKYPDMVFWIGLEFENTEEKLVQAVDRFIEKFKADFKKWEDIPKTIEIDGETIPTNPLDNNHPTRQKRLNRIVNNAEKFKNISRLIFNSICYLTYDEKEFTISYTNNPPKTLTDRLKKARKEKERKKVEEELLRSGYTKIKICGQKISSEYKNETTGTGKELSAHWRRGHWRNQPIGKDRQERKLIWIKPTLVHKDKGEPQQGHIYTIT